MVSPGTCTLSAATRSPSDLSWRDPAPPQCFPALTAMVSPALGTISLLPSAEALPQPRFPWCLQSDLVLAYSTWHTAHSTQECLPSWEFMVLPTPRESPAPAAGTPRSFVMPLAPQFVVAPLWDVPPANAPWLPQPISAPAAASPSHWQLVPLPNLAKALLAKGWD